VSGLFRRSLSIAAATSLVGVVVWSVVSFGLAQRVLFLMTPSWNRYAGAAAWLKANVPPGETIFHGRWDDFPSLFYGDDSHRYISGLDPTFFYRQDPELYWLAEDVAWGRRRVGLAGIIKNDFQAEYVFIRDTKDPIYPIVKNNPDFEQVYRGGPAMVYRVK
jgi:hypothetical protein